MSAVAVSSGVGEVPGLRLPEPLSLLLTVVVSVVSAEETAVRRLRLIEESDEDG